LNSPSPTSLTDTESFAAANWVATAQLASSQWNDVYRARPIAQSEGRGDYVLKSVKRDSDSNLANILLQREAQIAQNVSHENLITILDSNFEAERPFIVMPYLPGGDLQSLISLRMRPSLPFQLWLLRQVADALNALHTHRIVHGDVTPRNIAVGPDGHVTLFDLGLAQLTDKHEVPVFYLAGSVDYLAPEQLEDQNQITPAIDVYALAITACQLLTGKIIRVTSHVSGQHEIQAAVKTLIERSTNQAELVICELSELLQSMLDPHPSNRPTAAEVVQTLIRSEVNSFSIARAA
jgi:serine/threonine protein kinase